jgi:hypothetical protein
MLQLDGIPTVMFSAANCDQLAGDPGALDASPLSATDPGGIGRLARDISEAWTMQGLFISLQPCSRLERSIRL